MMIITPARRIENLPNYLFAEIDRKIIAAQRKGVDVIKLGIGDPDRPTPDYIVERMQNEVANPVNHPYPPAEGLLALKEAVADYYRRRHGVDLNPEREVTILIGSKEGIAHISACFTNPGDINLIPDPGYPVYGIGTMFAGGQSVTMPLLQENNYLPDLDAINQNVAERAKLIFLNYPNNPTGAVAPLEFFNRVIQYGQQNNIIVCHDMAYGEIAFDGYNPVSILEAPGAKKCCIEFGSLSKSFNMTGWRIGYAVGCSKVIEVLTRFKTNIDSGAFKAVQYAGIEALSSPKAMLHIHNMRQVYTERRNVVLSALGDMGFQIDPPLATFYVWVPIPPGFENSTEFVGALLDETGVVVTPGRGFGQYGEGYFRIALTVEADRMAEAMGRMKSFLGGR
jgi:LL-diaminopimelate aminotransferase